MAPQTTQQKWTVASLTLADAYTDFILSRQAMQCTPATLFFYKHTAGVFVSWLAEQGASSPPEVSARHVREYLAKLTGAGKSDNTVHDNARAIKTLLRFWHAESYIPAPVTFAMPKVAKKRLPVLSAEEMLKVLAACQNPRDKAAVLLIADAGLRRAETIALNWGDVDMSTGLVRVVRGKGGKARSSVVGSATRRALLQYRRTLKNTLDTAPLFQTRDGTRFVSDGFIQIFNRISKRSGVHVTPHALRRTFVILSLRAGMNVLHLQAMLGHASLDMVRHYAQMVDDDILQAHEAHSPMDNIKRLK